ncbi:hypothetical protein BDP81DRAFT_396268 [Colletotrichum phormii]|uniref:Uncharacterized protein n=1 Tax=Colletotrichum phormii TaxID=359342 RepID=A0AAI9ZLS4_9PEZI|nr:uncharacterized protein BDP81DRAFT_396268 [Colletotrichum phormii]KAK1634279.1 hypothetical protein BDP81DRAFT_396268 [Colletotrichum phormii]
MPKPPSDWVTEHVSSYNLRWDRLQEWLLKHFENDNVSAMGRGFSEKQHLNDTYFFYAPRRLTKQDKDAIDKIRDRNPDDITRQEQREIHTPDPEEQITDED